MAFIAEAPQISGAETLGVARVATDPDNIEAEFAVLVRSDLKGRGLGRLLLERLFRYCRSPCSPQPRSRTPLPGRDPCLTC